MGNFPYEDVYNPNLRKGYIFYPFAGYGFGATNMGDVDDFDINEWIFNESEFPDPTLDDALFPGAPFS